MNIINISSNLTDNDRTKEAGRIAAITITTVLLFSDLWILISLIHHGIQTGKWRKIMTNREEKLNGGLVYSSVVMTASFCALRLMLTLIHLNVGYNEGEDAICDLFAILVSVAYSCTIFSAMAFLWLRQRVFYTHRLLRVSYSRFTKTLSVSSIFLTFGSALFGFSVSRLHSKNFSSRFGCMATLPPPRDIALYLMLILLLATLGQAALLGLFFYALKKLKPSKTKTNVNACQSSSPNQSIENQMGNSNNVQTHENSSFACAVVQTETNQIQSKAPVHLALRRTLILAVFTFLSDAFFPWTFFAWSSVRGGTVIFNINVFLNTIFVIFSFTNFKQMLFSPYIKI